MALTDLLATGGVGGASALLGVYVSNRAAEKRERVNHDATEARERRGREADMQRERERELRALTDDAVRALKDMWRALGPFVMVKIAQQTDQPLYSPEHRPPSAEEFLDAYARLTDVHERLLLRVEWNDTLHAPVGAAVTAAQGTWNAVVNEGTLAGKDPKGDRAISYALQQAQIGYSELQQTARERFAPGGLSGSQRQVVLVLNVTTTREQAEPLVAALRNSRPNKVLGPNNDNRVTVREVESESGEARARLEASLDAIRADWRQHLALAPPPS
jgi:hypothetical protein